MKRIWIWLGPPPVDTLLTDEKVDGFTVSLAWNGYDETVDGDIKNYRIYQSLSNEKTGLASAPASNFKVSAVDNDQNLSGGTQFTGVTLLANPYKVTAEVHSGQVDLSWSGVMPSHYAKHYAIYASESDISSVAGMTPTRISKNNVTNEATDPAGVSRVEFSIDGILQGVSPIKL